MELPNFKCRICGIECPIAPDPPDRAVCETHCEDHQYEYDPWRRGHFCVNCDKQVDNGTTDGS